jgi:hypothetical protein
MVVRVPSVSNPWLDLPLAPTCVLPQDAPGIHAYNARARHERHRFRLDLMPEPYFGDSTAPVVVLLLNPGYTPEDGYSHADPAFRANFALR